MGYLEIWKSVSPQSTQQEFTMEFASVSPEKLEQVWSTQGTDSQWHQGFFSQGRELADSKVQAKLWEESPTRGNRCQ